MLVIGEAYNERKAFLLDCMTTSRHLIKQWQATSKRFPDLADGCREVIQLERQYVQDNFNELVALERWRLREGLDKNDRYLPKSL